jgi:ANTAR domain/GAF domain
VATAPELNADLDFLSDLLFSSQTLDSMLDALLQLAVNEVSGATGASITLTDGNGFRTSAHTSALFRKVDAIQYEEGFGPCLQTIRTGNVTHADFRNKYEWPGVGPRSLEYGVVEVMSGPLTGVGLDRGSLNIYATSADAFDETTEATVKLLGEVMSVLLRNYELYNRRGQVITQLHQALESRSVIDLAKGILMERETIDAGAAFDRLRSESQSRNIKVRDVANRIVRAEAKRAS